jgi:hypothetical protein
VKKYEIAQNQVAVYDRFVKCAALWEDIAPRTEESLGEFHPHLYLVDKARAVGLTGSGLSKVASRGFRAEVKALYDQARSDCVTAGLMSPAGEWL